MTDKPKDGGSAFPRPSVHVKPDNDRDYVLGGTEGMSLRDWFAGQALMGMAANTEIGKAMAAHKLGDSFVAMAECAYEAADAMIAEKERRDG